MGDELPFIAVTPGGAFHKLPKRFYISRVKAVGPDGITRDLAPIEVIVG